MYDTEIKISTNEQPTNVVKRTPEQKRIELAKNMIQSIENSDNKLEIKKYLDKKVKENKLQSIFELLSMEDVDRNIIDKITHSLCKK